MTVWDTTEVPGYTHFAKWWLTGVFLEINDCYDPSAQAAETNLTSTTLHFAIAVSRPLFVEDSDSDSYFLAEIKTTTLLLA